MLSAQGRDPSAARKSVGRLAITRAEQILSLAWNPVRDAFGRIRGSLVLSNRLLRTAVPYVPKVVSCPPTSRPPSALHQSPLQCQKLTFRLPFAFLPRDPGPIVTISKASKSS